ncbi:pre-rRNA-processing protein ESF2, partial [Tanacetum coccineum]
TRLFSSMAEEEVEIDEVADGELAEPVCFQNPFVFKNVAKRIASMLNGEEIGGKKKSQFYYDVWNIKYLSKFKWDHLTEEIALELSAAKKEWDFYPAKVDQSRALSSIDERLKKKRKMQQANGSTSEIPDDQQVAKVTPFSSNTSIMDNRYQQCYIIHRLLLCALARRAEHDRDHYGNKRLDLAGPLLGAFEAYLLFRMLFWKSTRDVRGYVQKVITISSYLNSYCSIVFSGNSILVGLIPMVLEVKHSVSLMECAT